MYLPVLYVSGHGSFDGFAWTRLTEEFVDFVVDWMLCTYVRYSQTHQSVRCMNPNFSHCTVYVRRLTTHCVHAHLYLITVNN